MLGRPVTVCGNWVSRLMVWSYQQHPFLFIAKKINNNSNNESISDDNNCNLLICILAKLQPILPLDTKK